MSWFLGAHDECGRKDHGLIRRLRLRSGLGTARPQPGSLFELPDSCQVVAVLLFHVSGNIFRRDVGCSKFAFDMTSSFRMEARAHKCVLEFCSRFNAFSLEFFSFLSFHHFELRYLIFVFDKTKPFLVTFVFIVFIARFALAAFFFVVISSWVGCIRQLCVSSC
jgi:hypothetical protein